MKIARYEPGDVVFHEGEKSQEAFRILSGRVEITIQGRTKPIILAQLSEGDIFGEMAMVDERPRSATARCVEAAECEVMGPADFQRAILQDPHRLLPYLSAFFERLRTVNDRLHLELRLRAESRAATIGQPMAPPVPRLRVPSPVPPVEHHPERIRKPAPFQPMHATTLEPESRVHSLRVSPLNPLCASKFEAGFGHLKIEKFPFRIGRGGDGENGARHSVFSANDFLIADQEPFQISRSHCSIEREGDHFFVRDRGSTLGTIVNGTPIGVQHAVLTVDLHAGENTLVLGSARSPYKFKIELE
jgi:hypothetical protein